LTDPNEKFDPCNAALNPWAKGCGRFHQIQCGQCPVEDDTRPVTSGDMMKIFAAHAEKKVQTANA
jgi:hypothetical protein